MPSKRRENRDIRNWCRGYYCAVAVLIREAGCVEANVRGLFDQGGDPELADSADLALFREHGLLPPNAGINRSREAASG